MLNFNFSYQSLEDLSVCSVCKLVDKCFKKVSNKNLFLNTRQRISELNTFFFIKFK